jgi:hypothetical protein
MSESRTEQNVEAEALIVSVEDSATKLAKAFGFDSQRRLMERAVVELHKQCSGCGVCSSATFKKAVEKSASLGPKSTRTGLAAMAIYSAQITAAQAREALTLGDTFLTHRLMNRAQSALLNALGQRLGIALGQIDGAASGARRATAIKAAEARHSKPDGTREKRAQMQAIWATGKYSNRDLCAEQECEALGISFSTARKALRGAPEPSRSEEQLAAASRLRSHRGT